MQPEAEVTSPAYTINTATSIMEIGSTFQVRRRFRVFNERTRGEYIYPGSFSFEYMLYNNYNEFKYKQENYMNKILTRTILGISITISVVLIVLFISYNMEIRKEKEEDTYTENNNNTETEDDTDISQKESVDNTDEGVLTVSNNDNEVNPFPNDKFDHSGLSSERFNLYLSLMEDDSSEITDERLEWLDIGLEFVEVENRERFKERIDKLRAQ